MNRSHAKNFMSRERERVGALKREHRAARYRASNGRSGIEAAVALHRYVRGVRTDWPSARERASDLAHHVSLKERIDRAAPAFAIR